MANVHFIFYLIWFCVANVVAEDKRMLVSGQDVTPLKLQNIETKLQDLQNQLSSTKLHNIETTLQNFQNELSSTKSQLTAHESKFATQEQTIMTQGQIITAQQLTNTDQEHTIKAQQTSIAELQKKLLEQEANITAQQQTIINQDHAIKTQETSIAEMQKKLLEQEANITAQQIHVLQQESTITGMESNLTDVLSHNFIDEMAQAMCSAANDQKAFVFAIRRNCYSGHAPTCSSICSSASPQMLANSDAYHNNVGCFDAFLIQKTHAHLDANPGPMQPNEGKPFMFVYRYLTDWGCSYKDSCGPNYCCCRVTH